MIITVDANEARCGVVERLRRGWTDVCVEPLETGDFRVGTRILIERKTTVDFVASLRDGRLFSQANRLLRTTPRSLMLVEGDPLDVDQTLEPGVTRGVLLTLMIGYRIPILHTRDLEDTAATICHVAVQEARRIARGVDPPVQTPPWRRKAAGSGASLERATVNMLATLPGIGPVRAKSLARHVGGIAALARLSLRELRAIPGIGPDTAARIHDAIHAGAPAREPTEHTAEVTSTPLAAPCTLAPGTRLLNAIPKRSADSVGWHGGSDRCFDEY